MSFLSRMATTLLFGTVVSTTYLSGQTPSLWQAELDTTEASTLVETINAELREFIASGRRAANLVGSRSAIELRVKQRAEALKTIIRSDPAEALTLALPDPQLQRLHASFPNSAAEIEVRGQWTGELEYLIADNDTTGVSWEIHRLRTVSGDRDVFLSEQSQYQLENGDTVEVSGLRVDSVIAGIVTGVYRSAQVGQECSSTGEQRTAVLLTTFPGVPLPQAPLQDVHDIFFDASGYSLDSYWRDASYGSTYATGDVFGWFTLDQTYTCNEVSKIMNAAIQAADAQVDFRNYDRLFIFFRDLRKAVFSGGRVPSVV